MPCCGLTEYRERVPIKYTAAGLVVFWGGFAVALTAGLLTCWLPWGRHVLRSCGAFLLALWGDTMRNPASPWTRLCCSNPALMNEVNNGCPSRGVEVNSGWNWQP